MNARVSALDRYMLVSNSDAHSPGKLGREANLLDIDWGYDALADALQGRNSAGFRGTIEFFPEEGKYHLDGHRSCGVCLTPAETDTVWRTLSSLRRENYNRCGTPHRRACRPPGGSKTRNAL